MSLWLAANAVPSYSMLRTILLFSTMLLGVIGRPAEAFALQITPTSLTFAATQGSANPPAQVVSLSKRGERSKTWSVATSAPWLTVTPMSGAITTETDQVSVGANITGLAAGNYSGSVVITTAGFGGRKWNRSIRVTLTVAPATAAPAIGVNPASLSFSGTTGGTNPASKTSTVSNTGGGTLA